MYKKYKRIWGGISEKYKEIKYNKKNVSENKKILIKKINKENK